MFKPNPQTLLVGFPTSSLEVVYIIYIFFKVYGNKKKFIIFVDYMLKKTTVYLKKTTKFHVNCKQYSKKMGRLLFIRDLWTCVCVFF